VGTTREVDSRSAILILHFFQHMGAFSLDLDLDLNGGERNQI
jgi:hypothetical protein